LEAIRGRFGKLEAVFESFFDYIVWGIKSYGINMYKECSITLEGLGKSQAS